MSAETALIAALAAYFARPGLLQPAPATAGAAEPAAQADLPAVVMSLPEVRRLGAGLGERASLVTGALRVQAVVDLANPVLPEDPTFNLLSPDRRTLVLPHGGWVRADGLDGLLSGADLQVNVAGGARTVVNAAPGAGEVQPDGPTGALLFGAALPAAGTVQADYFIGQWERRMTPIAGRLQLAVHAAAAADVAALSGALLDAMDDTEALPAGLHKVALLSLSAIGPTDPLRAGSRARLLSNSFEYEHQIDRPDSSGGVIRRIPITSHLQSTAIEPASGAITTTLTTEFTEAEP
jgi:hypothetical protein